MANKKNGELEIVAPSGKYIIRFGTYAIAELETALDRSMVSIALELDDADNRRVKTIITALWAGLQENHPKIDYRAAADLMDEVGFVNCALKIGEGLTLAFPKIEEAEGTGNPLNRNQRRASKKRA